MCHTNCWAYLWTKELKSKVCCYKILLSSTKSLTFLLMFWIQSWWKKSFSFSTQPDKTTYKCKGKWALIRIPILWAPFRNSRGCQHHFFAKKHFNWKENSGVLCKIEHLWCLEMYLVLLLRWREKQPMTLECTAVQTGVCCDQRLGQ